MELLGKANPEFYNKKIPMIKEAGEAFVNMKKEALKEGIKIEIVSGFRSYNRQKQIWNRKFRINKMNGLSPQQNILKIIEYSTLPGTSRHHWGTDIDIIDGNKTVSGDVLLEKISMVMVHMLNLENGWILMLKDLVFIVPMITIQKEKDSNMSHGITAMLQLQFQC